MKVRNVIFEFGAVPLAAYGLVASWRRPHESQQGRWVPGVIVMQSSTVDDGVFSPAAEVTVNGVEALTLLRSAIDEALKASQP